MDRTQANAVLLSDLCYNTRYTTTSFGGFSWSAFLAPVAGKFRLTDNLLPKVEYQMVVCL
jgi:hypothetical protein